MSYDIDATPVACPHCKRAPDGWHADPTYNLREIFVAAFGGNGVRDFGGKTASEILPTLERGIADMRARPDYYEALNPSNGWGSYEGVLPILADMLEYCRANPDAAVSVT